MKAWSSEFIILNFRTETVWWVLHELSSYIRLSAVSTEPHAGGFNTLTAASQRAGHEMQNPCPHLLPGLAPVFPTVSSWQVWRQSDARREVWLVPSWMAFLNQSRTQTANRKVVLVIEGRREDGSLFEEVRRVKKLEMTNNWSQSDLQERKNKLNSVCKEQVSLEPLESLWIWQKKQGLKSI